MCRPLDPASPRPMLEWTRSAPTLSEQAEQIAETMAQKGRWIGGESQVVRSPIRRLGLSKAVRKDPEAGRDGRPRRPSRPDCARLLRQHQGEVESPSSWNGPLATWMAEFGVKLVTKQLIRDGMAGRSTKPARPDARAKFHLLGSRCDWLRDQPKITTPSDSCESGDGGMASAPRSEAMSSLGPASPWSPSIRPCPATRSGTRRSTPCSREPIAMKFAQPRRPWSDVQEVHPGRDPG